MNIGIYIYKDVEVLDFAGPYEVFSTANRFVSESSRLSISLLAESRSIVNARGGFKVEADYSILSHPHLDVVIVPGGLHESEMNHNIAIDWISSVAASASIVASVCTGAFLLAKAGVISNHAVTTHWEDQAELQNMFPELQVMKGIRWVDCGPIITSGGISAGIDMSLRLVEKLMGRDVAIKTAKQMEFDWNEQGVVM